MTTPSISTHDPHLLVERARIFATAAHSAVGQRRKYTGEPYIVHPSEVVSILKTVPHTPAQLAAAWLHDVLEDTQITADVMMEHFGADVTDMVLWLTDTNDASMNRSQRKARDRQRLAMAPSTVQSIKAADLISNTHSIVEHDPKFAQVYLAEKRLLLPLLSGADATLLQRAWLHASTGELVVDTE